MKAYLMNKNKEVALINFNEEYCSIDEIYEIINIEFAPLSLFNAFYDSSQNNTKVLNRWFKGRGIPSWRKDLERLLFNLGINTTEELLDKAFALSLSDQYWLKPKDMDIQWKNINFFDHDFEYKGFFDASMYDSASQNTELKTPNNTTDGMLQKAWIIENGKRILVKGTYTMIGQEPINEWLTTKICERLDFPHCPYTIDVLDNKLISKCENFISPNQEIITAHDVFFSEKQSNNDNDYQHYLKILKKHHVPNAQNELENMLIVDYLMMNTDRHLKNFGVIRNVETLEWERLVPIFDTGQAMNCDKLTKDMNFHDGRGKLFTNTHKKFSTYLSYIEDFKRIELSKLDGLDMKLYETLKCVQPYTELTDIRIQKIIDGFKNRVQLLENYKELAINQKNEIENEMNL